MGEVRAGRPPYKCGPLTVRRSRRRQGCAQFTQVLRFYGFHIPCPIRPPNQSPRRLPLPRNKRPCLPFRLRKRPRLSGRPQIPRATAIGRRTGAVSTS